MSKLRRAAGVSKPSKDTPEQEDDDEESDIHLSDDGEGSEFNEEFLDPAFAGQQGIGQDGVWNIQSYIDHKLVECNLPHPHKPTAVRVDLCLGNERTSLFRIKGKISNMSITKCSNVVLMVDEISMAFHISESENVSVVIRGAFPSPMSLRAVQGLQMSAGQNNIHSSVSCSRAMGVVIEGVIKAGQPEPPFPAVSKRMPIDVWDFEHLLKSSEGRERSHLPADGVFVLQSCRITKCADILNRHCLTGEPVLMWHPDGGLADTRQDTTRHQARLSKPQTVTQQNASQEAILPVKQAATAWLGPGIGTVHTAS